MHHGLAGSLTDVNAAIEAVGVTFLHQNFLHLSKQVEQCSLFFSGGLKEGGNVAFRDDQTMAGGNWKAVKDCDCMNVGQDDPRIVRIAEGARS